LARPLPVTGFVVYFHYPKNPRQFQAIGWPTLLCLETCCKNVAFHGPDPREKARPLWTVRLRRNIEAPAIISRHTLTATLPNSVLNAAVERYRTGNVTIDCDLSRISAALDTHLQRRSPSFDKTKRLPTERVMTTKNAAPSDTSARRETPDLDGRYGKIGISAVAAALPYQSEVKNPAYAPVEPELDAQPDYWSPEIAA
jgi:hypothetical protein